MKPTIGRIVHYTNLGDADGKYPPNTLLMIDRLVGEPFLVEVQPVAAL